MYKEFWKSKLNMSCQALYDKMVCEFGRMKEHVQCDSFLPDEISNTYIAVYNDHPEFFYLPHNPQLQRRVAAVFGGSTTLIAKFIYSETQIQSFNQEISRIKKLFLEKKRRSKSSLELEKEIVDYCLQNFSYAIDNVYNQNAASPLVKHIGQCSGISKAVKLIFDAVSIPAIVVSGNAYDPKNNKYEPHSWNVVFINGCSYHLDVTMMMGSNITKSLPYRYTHFNLSDEELVKSHSWNKTDIPQCLTHMEETTANSSMGDHPNSSIYYEVRSLVEYKQYFKEKIKLCKYDVTVKNRITGYTDNNLLKLYCSATEAVLSQLNIGGRYEISIANNIVRVQYHKE